MQAKFISLSFMSASSFKHLLGVYRYFAHKHHVYDVTKLVNALIRIKTLSGRC
ncbi:conserved hypothetical protein [Escherichia coli]|uniref:Uncharacterized protein n=2 Tax=Escherichia coli TaxID=562 RepID=B7LDR7_ECO55|nr:hypothetical protein O3M_22095 [Escherichia coli O104:H4 str. 2009EL-2050]AFS76295.1 hypothetical protein O3K_22195 [Escherichia coli O104:H4 str. 2011C-3493]AFS84419.1 hypothetical protein O3O_03195 [Escherichia coli O104:H4 str. 2009EL-2071]AKE86201.1 hypothetical protein AAF13_19680 [Escherichia coli O104:H4 str. C227-11]ALD36839.1 hypothetical protein AN204_20470 [Escherichia coli]EFU48583.1 hypothetical protein HMPREF9539_00843 [Escherichia coli MS 110-3]EGR60221.1 hypothetical protei